VSSLAIIQLFGLLIIGLFGFFTFYYAKKRAEQAGEWWRTCCQTLGLDGDFPDDNRGWFPTRTRYHGTGRIAGRDFSIRQRHHQPRDEDDNIEYLAQFIAGRSFPTGQRHRSRSKSLCVEYLARFDLDPPDIQLTDHLQASNSVSLRVGIPRFDQKTVVDTDVPVDALHVFAHDDLGATIHRIFHLDDTWSVSNGTLEVTPTYTDRTHNDARDRTPRQKAVDELKEELERAAEFCDKLETASNRTTDRRWRPRTKVGRAWQSVANDRDLEFACSETNYEDAALKGELDGRSLTAHTAGKGNRPPSRMQLRLSLPDKPYDVEFNLDANPRADSDRQELLEAIAHGHDDLSTEDTDSGFDRVYEISGDRITAYGHLGRPGVEPALLELYRPGLHVRIQSNELELTLEDPPETAEALNELLDDLTVVADALEGHASDADVLELIDAVGSADAGVSWNGST